MWKRKKDRVSPTVKRKLSAISEDCSNVDTSPIAKVNSLVEELEKSSAAGNQYSPKLEESFKKKSEDFKSTNEPPVKKAKAPEPSSETASTSSSLRSSLRLKMRKIMGNRDSAKKPEDTSVKVAEVKKNKIQNRSPRTPVKVTELKKSANEAKSPRTPGKVADLKKSTNEIKSPRTPVKVSELKKNPNEVKSPRTQPSAPKKPLRLKTFKFVEPFDFGITGTYTVLLTKVDDKLGFIMEHRPKQPYFIKFLLNKPALTCGKIMPGDQIVEINERKILPSMTYNEVKEIIENAGPQVKLTLEREPIDFDDNWDKKMSEMFQKKN